MTERIIDCDVAATELIALLDSLKANPLYSKRSHDELLGVLVALYCGSDKRILTVAYAALEEANCHTVNKQVQVLIDQCALQEKQEA